MIKIARRFAVPAAAAAVAAALPLAFGPGGELHEHHAHGQSGTCRPSPGDICIYNGNYALDYEHVDGSGG
jgi:hypothetical protein